MNSTLFNCPVCGAPLTWTEKTAQCPKHHSFDRAAKGGYINLLPPARRGSDDPGDSSEMCQARTRFLGGGWYAKLREVVAVQAASLSPRAVLDAGCGEGYYTARVGQLLPRKASIAGIDLSRYALRHAGKTCPSAQFAVASLFALPMADASCDLVLHLFAPMCASEFARVLQAGGHLITVTPAPRHLWGLKQALYENPYENPAAVRQLEGFSFVQEILVEDTIALPDTQSIQDLFSMTPYAWKTSKQAQEKLFAMDRLQTEIAFQVHVYKRNP